MPTLLRINGFRVVIYTADHVPMHVHVINVDGASLAIRNTRDFLNCGITLINPWDEG